MNKTRRKNHGLTGRVHSTHSIHTHKYEFDFINAYRRVKRADGRPPFKADRDVDLIKRNATWNTVRFQDETSCRIREEIISVVGSPLFLLAVPVRDLSFLSIFPLD